MVAIVPSFPDPTPSQLAELTLAMLAAKVIYCHPDDRDGIVADVIPTARAHPQVAPGITGPECIVADLDMPRGVMEPRPELDPSRRIQG